VLIWFVASRPATSVDRLLVAEAMAEPFQLEDGSRISLDPGSRGRLRTGDIGVQFNLQQGRASFDVRPRHGRGWTVNAGWNEVRVVGTRFNVSYTPGEVFEVEVERGMVAVQVPDRPGSIELKAGEQFRASPERAEAVREASSAPELARPTSSAPELARPTGSEPTADAEAPQMGAASGPESNVTRARAADWQADYRAGNYAEALVLARSSGADKRLGELSASALLELSEAARLGGDPELAVRALTALLRRFPVTSEAREARFLLGRVQALRGEGASAIEAFEGYLASGATRYASEALGRLMELYSARGDTDRAREIARRYLERAPNGPYHRLAQSLSSR
jgi:TolA-binding protein